MFLKDLFTPASEPQAPRGVPDLDPWLVLSRLPRLRLAQRIALLENFADPLQLLTLPEAQLIAMQLAPATCQMISAWQRGDSGHPEIAKCVSIARRCNELGITLLGLSDPQFPPALRAIPDPPLLLFIQGAAALLHHPQIAVVGSRRASAQGLSLAREIAGELVDFGFQITSGLALGIDGAAHEGALHASGTTIAVIGTGHDQPYPRSHIGLRDRIARQGVVVSEYPPGTPARAGHFPRRNRIISGLAQGILVVEAGLKSGSLITAHTALEQGREVFAMPGSVRNPESRGCHYLIRQGAHLVESASDIVAELSAFWVDAPERRALEGMPAHGERAAKVGRSEAPAGPAEGCDAHAVLQALGYDPQSTDDLCEATGLAAPPLLQALLTLELEGLVEAVPGGYQRIR